MEVPCTCFIAQIRCWERPALDMAEYLDHCGSFPNTDHGEKSTDSDENFAKQKATDLQKASKLPC